MRNLSRLILSSSIWGVASLGKKNRVRLEEERVQIRLVDKIEFFHQFVENNKDDIILIVYDTSKLKQHEAVERERNAIQASKSLGQVVSESNNKKVKILIVREEDYRVVEKSWETTTRGPKPVLLHEGREVHVFFKPQGFKGGFLLNEAIGTTRIEEVKTQRCMEAMKKRIEMLSRPVVEVRTEQELKREMSRTVGVHNRPVVVDVCDLASFSKENEALTEYMLTRILSKSIPPESRALLVDSKLVSEQKSKGKIQVVKNDFVTLHALQKTCEESKEFRSHDPTVAAAWMVNHLKGVVFSGLEASSENFTKTKEKNRPADFLDKEILPRVPIFYQEEAEGIDLLYTHIFQNIGKKILSLNLLKQDPQSRDNANLLYTVIEKGDFEKEIAYQVFVESSYSKYFKHLNKYYSPFCIYNLDSPVRKSHQKIFVDLPFCCSITEFYDCLKFALYRSLNPLESDRILFGEGSFQDLTTQGFANFSSFHTDKHRLVISVDPSDKHSLLYERHLLASFGKDERVLLGRVLHPNRIPGPSQKMVNPSLVLSPAHSDKNITYELPGGFLDRRSIQDMLSSMDTDIRHNIN